MPLHTQQDHDPLEPLPERRLVDLLQFGDHRGVIGGSQPFLLLAIVPIHLHMADPLHHWDGPEDQIDTKTVVPVERTGPIVPP